MAILSNLCEKNETTCYYYYYTTRVTDKNKKCSSKRFWCAFRDNNRQTYNFGATLDPGRVFLHHTHSSIIPHNREQQHRERDNMIHNIMTSGPRTHPRRRICIIIIHWKSKVGYSPDVWLHSPEGTSSTYGKGQRELWRRNFTNQFVESSHAREMILVEPSLRLSRRGDWCDNNAMMTEEILVDNFRTLYWNGVAHHRHTFVIDITFLSRERRRKFYHYLTTNERNSMTTTYHLNINQI